MNWSIKIIILISFAIASAIGLFAIAKGPVDPVGSYNHKQGHQQVISNKIQLKSDATFIFQYSYYDGSVSTRYIRGKYEITRKKLRFFIKEFESTSSPLIAKTERVVIKNRPKGGVVSEAIRPEQFKKLLAKFETRALQLKPIYFFKQVGGKLSLCLKDVKSGRYVVEFEKDKN